jgi:hypothetical protein
VPQYAKGDGRLFVTAKHRPRAWHHRALENPEVSATLNVATTHTRAVPVSEEEFPDRRAIVP